MLASPMRGRGFPAGTSAASWVGEARPGCRTPRSLPCGGPRVPENGMGWRAGPASGAALLPPLQRRQGEAALRAWKRCRCAGPRPAAVKGCRALIGQAILVIIPATNAPLPASTSEFRMAGGVCWLRHPACPIEAADAGSAPVVTDAQHPGPLAAANNCSLLALPCQPSEDQRCSADRRTRGARHARRSAGAAQAHGLGRMPPRASRGEGRAVACCRQGVDALPRTRRGEASWSHAAWAPARQVPAGRMSQRVHCGCIRAAAPCLLLQHLHPWIYLSAACSAPWSSQSSPSHQPAPPASPLSRLHPCATSPRSFSMQMFSLATARASASAAAAPAARGTPRSSPRPGPQLPHAPHAAPGASNIVVAAAAVSSAAAAPPAAVPEVAPAAAPPAPAQPSVELTARRRVTHLLMEWDRFQ